MKDLRKIMNKIRCCCLKCRKMNIKSFAFVQITNKKKIFFCLVVDSQIEKKKRNQR